jgi:hypothetical protein
MKIIRFNAENVLKLKAVDITPDGNVVVISGKNAAGKSSVLNAIWLALGGGEASRAIKQPLRLGEPEGFVELDLGDMTVRREWSGDQTKLKVENKAGARYPSPQSMLDALIGRLSFDPVAFASMDDKKQVDTLRELTGLDFTEHDRDFKAVYDERTFVNRQLKEAEAQLKSKTAPKGAELTMYGPDEIKANLDEAYKTHEHCNNLAIKHNGFLGLEEVALADIKHYKAKLLEAEERLADLAVSISVTASTIEAMKPLPDIKQLTDMLARVAEHNERVKEREAYRALQDRVSELAGQAARHTMKLQELDAVKEMTLAGTDMPIEGMSFEGDTVLYRGIPFKQCSAAEQLRVSLAMAMALNPELKVIRVLDASLLDSDNMAVIEKMATDHDYQVWLEVVADQAGMGVYIEDGAVA